MNIEDINKKMEELKSQLADAKKLEIEKKKIRNDVVKYIKGSKLNYKMLIPSLSEKYPDESSEQIMGLSFVSQVIDSLELGNLVIRLLGSSSPKGRKSAASKVTVDKYNEYVEMRKFNPEENKGEIGAGKCAEAVGISYSSAVKIDRGQLTLEDIS